VCIEIFGHKAVACTASRGKCPAALRGHEGLSENLILHMLAILSTCLPNLQRTTNGIRKVCFQMCFQFHDVSCKSNFLGLVRRSRVCPLQRLDRGELRRWREVGLATDSKTREPHTSSANKKQAGWLIYLRDGKGLYYAL